MTPQQAQVTEYGGDYDRYQGRMAHEDMLIAQRVSWLVSSQSFLLAPYVVLRVNHGIPVIGYVIVAIGLTTALLTYVSVAAGVHAMLRLKAAYDQHMSVCVPLTAFKPAVDLSRIDTRQGLLAPRGLVYCFLISWITLLMVSLKSDQIFRWFDMTEMTLLGIGIGMIVSIGAYCMDKAAIQKIKRELR